MTQFLRSNAVLAALLYAGGLFPAHDGGMARAQGTQGQGAAPVRIVNPVPVPVMDGGEPVSFRKQLFFDAAQTVPYTTVYTVPEGKLLIIDHFSQICSVGAAVIPAVGQSVIPQLRTGIKGAEQVVLLSQTPPLAGEPRQNEPWFAYSSVSQMIRHPGDSSMPVEVRLTRNGHSGSFTCTVLFNGRLINRAP